MQTYKNTIGAFVLLASIFVPFFSAQAVEYGGVGGRPAYPREDNPRTQSIFVYSATPGQVIEDGVSVINNSSEPKTLMVYGGDYSASSGGGFACRQFTEDQVAVGSWIKLKKSEVTLEPKTNELVPFTLTIPDNAPVGESNGCILIEEKKATTDTADEKSGVSLSFRTGLRVAITIPGDIVKDLTIEQFGIEKKQDGNILLKAKIHNSGNVSIDSDVAIKTNNILGQVVAEHGGDFSILRDQTNDFNFELKRPFWGGVYAARLTVAYDPSVTTELGRESGQEKRVLKADRVLFFSAPQPIALGIEVGLLLIILIAFVSSVRNRRRMAWIENQWGRYIVQDSDTLYGLAQTYGISWKILARVNHLSAPYILRPGMVLRTPLKAKRRDILDVPSSGSTKKSSARPRVSPGAKGTKKNSKK